MLKEFTSRGTGAEFIDSNHNAKADQSRWVNAAGSRWGVDTDENGTIDAWKTISAEETTAEIVAALRSRDAAVFNRLLPTKAELAAVGFEGQRLADVTARVVAAARDFARVAAAQKQLGPKARWNNMLASQPGVLPAGGPGVVNDVVAYDNVVALVDAGGDAKSSGANAQIYVGSLVRFGDAWRPIDAPQVPGDAGEIVEPLGFFAARTVGRLPDDTASQERARASAGIAGRERRMGPKQGEAIFLADGRAIFILVLCSAILGNFTILA